MNAKKYMFWIGLAAIIVVLIGVLVGVVLIRRNDGNKQVDTYSECRQSKDSVVTQSYPSACTTKGGQRFVNPDERVQTLPDNTAPTY
jgi:hypothetical protein